MLDGNVLDIAMRYCEDGNGFINTFSSSYANLQCVYKLGIKKVYILYIYMSSIIKIKVLLIYINLQYV